MGMGMGIREPALPDTCGLPQYKVTKIIRQTVGDEIHFLIGNESFGQVHWHCIISMKAEAALLESRECEALALEAVGEAAVRLMRQRH